MYILKQIPQDFVVKEKSLAVIVDKGEYAYFTVHKMQLDTMEAVARIAKALGMREKDIGFAGNKDTQAVTEQVCSALHVRKDKIEQLHLSHISLTFLGYGTKPISLGDLQGNYFEITIRNLDQEKISRLEFMPNYFDEQRFSRHNAEVGKLILLKKFKEAVALVDDRRVKQYLEEKPNDAVGALKQLPIRLLRLYVNAYQSYLWNETLAQYLNDKGNSVRALTYSLGKLIFVEDAEKFKDIQIPLIGFDTPRSAFDNIIAKLMQREHLQYTDFIIKAISELSLQGEMRKAFVQVKDLKIGAREKDELNEGKKKVKVAFFLAKGSYATMVVKAMVRD